MSILALLQWTPLKLVKIQNLSRIHLKPNKNFTLLQVVDGLSSASPTISAEKKKYFVKFI